MTSHLHYLFVHLIPLEFERLCELIGTDKDVELLASSIENKLLRSNFKSSQSNLRSFRHKPLQATTFSNFMRLVNQEDPSRFISIIVSQCDEMLKYSIKLNSDLRLEENQQNLNSLTKMGATNQVSFYTVCILDFEAFCRLTDFDVDFYLNINRII